jgi:hypothetical protein
MKESEVRSRLAAAVLALTLCASPAFGQPRQIKPFDETPIKEGIAIVQTDGECSVQYIVAKTGRAGSIVADCSVPDMAPYVARAVAGAAWKAETVLGEPVDSYPLSQLFKFGVRRAIDPRGEKAPALTKAIDNNELRQLLEKTQGKIEGCNATFAVGVDGRPKDVVTNCRPSTLDPGVAAAIEKMRYAPGEKGGKPADWPGMQMPMVFVELR